MTDLELVARELACKWTLGNIAEPRVGMLDRIVADLLPALTAASRDGYSTAMLDAATALDIVTEQPLDRFARPRTVVPIAWVQDIAKALRTLAEPTVSSGTGVTTLSRLSARGAPKP